MASPQRHAKKHAKAKYRQRLNARARHERQQHHAQRDIHALHQALHDLGVPDTLVLEIAGRLRVQKKLLAPCFGLMFPTLFGCPSASEVTRVRGWEKHLPSRLLGALPKRSWLTRLRKLGQDIRCPLWRHAQSMSTATRSRWQWIGVWDDTVFRKYGQDFARVGRRYSGPHKRVVSGIDGVLLLIVMGDGTRIVPVDCAVRRPDPTGPSARSRNTLAWAQVLLDQRLAALARRGLRLPRPIAVAESEFSDSKRMRHVHDTHRGSLLFDGAGHLDLCHAVALALVPSYPD